MKAKMIISTLAVLALAAAVSAKPVWGPLTSAAEEVQNIASAAWASTLSQSRIAVSKPVVLTATFTHEGEVSVIEVLSAPGKQAAYAASNAVTLMQPFTEFGAALKAQGYGTATVRMTFSPKAGATIEPLEFESHSFAPDPDRKNGKAKEARERYIAEHPETPAPVRDAILKGELLVGMWVMHARAALGGLSFSSRSEGTGGTVEEWRHNDGAFTRSLYFYDGRLTRWSTYSN